MIIPIDQLEKPTLLAIIEQFVLTEGTDYGDQEITLSDKVQQVLQQLENGDAVLVYSELHETVNIMSADQFSEENEC